MSIEYETSVKISLSHPLHRALRTLSALNKRLYWHASHQHVWRPWKNVELVVRLGCCTLLPKEVLLCLEWMSLSFYFEFLQSHEIKILRAVCCPRCSGKGVHIRCQCKLDQVFLGLTLQFGLFAFLCVILNLGEINSWSGTADCCDLWLKVERPCWSWPGWHQLRTTDPGWRRVKFNFDYFTIRFWLCFIF